MLWLWGVLCALALVVLFFPFVFWIDFGAGPDGAKFRLCLYKKCFYSHETKFGRKAAKTAPVEKAEAPRADVAAGTGAPEETPAAPPSGESIQTNSPVPEPDAGNAPSTGNTAGGSASDPADKAPEGVEKSEESEEPATRDATPKEGDAPGDAPANEPPQGDAESKNSDSHKGEDDGRERRRSLTSKEFWTLILTPEFDSRAFWAARHSLSSLFKLFRIKFVGCFVEGIRMDYLNMGYAAALNGFLKSFPYIGVWDFRMDWTRDHDLRTEGRVRASVNLFRILSLSLATTFYGGIIAVSFWRRRSRILKTGELPELGFIRNKIVKLMTEDD